MFNKNEFAKIIKNIKETYNSQEDFAIKSGVGRTYLSQYMNMKLDKPPKPEILERLANASHDITTYEELMEICGYNDDNIFDIDTFINNSINDEHYKNINLESLKNRTIQEEVAIQTLLRDYRNTLIHSKEKSNFNISSYTKNLDYKSKRKVLAVFSLYLNNLSNFIKEIDSNELLETASDRSQFYMCPVYGRISAGQPNWAEECIEGRIPIDPNLMNIVNPEEHFFLRVNGESMNKVIRNGAFALIHKQDIVENGEIAVVLVNGYDATLKKFTKQGNLVILEPQSNDESFKTQVYDKNTSIKILGKYVGKMEMNR